MRRAALVLATLSAVALSFALLWRSGERGAPARPGSPSAAALRDAPEELARALDAPGAARTSVGGGSTGTLDGTAALPPLVLAPAIERPPERYVVRCVDEEGRPIAGARVLLDPGWAWPEGVPPPEALADATAALGPPVAIAASGVDGVAAIPGDAVPRGETPWVEREGHARVGLELVRHPGTVWLGDVVLPKGWSVRGRVRDESGGVPRAAVVALVLSVGGAKRMEDVQAQRRTAVATDGTFRLSGLPLEGHFALRACAPGHRPASLALERDALPPEGCELVLAALDPERMLAVRVLAPDGGPADRAQLWVDGRFLGTGASGRFELEVGSADPVHLFAHDPLGRWIGASADVRPGGPVDLRLFEVPPLLVRVHDPDGVPVPEPAVRVRAGSREGGELRREPGLVVCRVPNGPFGLELSAPGFRPRRIPTQQREGREEIVLVLRRGHGLRGRVVHEGRSVVGARVADLVLGKDGAFGASGDDAATTDAHGAFELLPQEGRVGLRVDAPGFGTTIAGPFVADGSREPVVRIELAGALEGRVIVPDGNDPTGARLTLRRDSWRKGPSTFVTAGPDGRFAVAELPPGEWTAAIGGCTGPPWRFQVASGETTRLELHWAPEGTVFLRGSVTLVGATPRRWYATLAVRRADGRPGATVDSKWIEAEGGFELRGWQPGTHVLLLSSKLRGGGELRIEAPVDLALGVQDRRLRVECGRLLLAGGFPTLGAGQRLFHRALRPDGARLTTPLAPPGPCPVPSGPGEVGLLEGGSEWRPLATVDVPASGEATVDLPSGGAPSEG